MDKDLATAAMLERCACYDRSLAAARKVLEKFPADAEEAYLARRIVRSLGEEFLKQRFADKALDCYRLLMKHAAPAASGCPAECPDADFPAKGSLSDLGTHTIPTTTHVSADVMDILTTLETSPCADGKSVPELVREGIYLLILRYATEKEVRDLVFDKLKSVILNTENAQKKGGRP